MLCRLIYVVLRLPCVVSTTFKFLYPPDASVGRSVLKWVDIFNERTNHKHSIKPEAIEFSRMGEAVSTDLVSGIGQYAGYVWLSGEIATNGPYLADLTEKVLDDANLRWSDLAAFFRRTLVYDNKIVMLQIDGDFHNFNYRKDILDRDGKDPPQTLEDVTRLAIEYNGTDLNEDGEPDYGFCFCFPGDDRTVGILLMSYYAGSFQTKGTRHGVLLDPDDLSYNINNSVFSNIVALLKRSLLEGSNLDFLMKAGAGWEIRKAFLSGRCMFYLDWADIPVMLSAKNLIGDYMTKWDNATGLPWVATSPTGTRVVSGPAPGHRIVWDRKTQTARPCDQELCPFADKDGLNRPAYAAGGGWSLMVNGAASPEEQDAVYELFSFIAAPEQNLIDVLDGASGMEPCRYSQLTWQLWAQEGMEPAYAKQWLEATKGYFEDPNLVMEVPIMLGGKYQEAVGKYFMQFLLEKIDADGLISSITKEWDTITLEAGGKDSQIKSYRKGLGLPDLIVSCPAGEGQVKGSVDCRPCSRGSYSTGGTQGCLPCPVGHEALSNKSSWCNPCRLGTFKNVSGAADCSPCESGRYQNQWGTSACFPCDHGKAQNHEGQTSCNACDEGTSTHGKGWSLCTNVSAGFMALQEDNGNYLVYRCFAGERSCPEGRSMFASPDSMCLNGHLGRACAQCRIGMYVSTTGCQDCDDLPYGSPVASNIVTLLIFIITSERMFYFSMFPPEAIKLTVHQVISFAQALFVLGGYSFSFPASVRSIFDSSSVMKLDFTVIGLPLECKSGWHFPRRYAFTVFKWIWLWIGFIIIYMLSRLIRFVGPYVWNIVGSKLFNNIHSHEVAEKRFNVIWQTFYDTYTFFAEAQTIPLKTKLMWYYPIDRRDMVNCFFKAQDALFILMTSTSLAVFRLSQQPSDQYTVADFADVRSGTSEWFTSVIIAIAGLLLFSISFFAYFCYLVMIAPVRMGDTPNFARSYRGLWSKFDPSAWWFGIVQLLYNLMLNLIPVVVEQRRLQLVDAVILNSVYILVVCHVRPWNYSMNHIADLLTKMGITILILLTVAGPLGEELGQYHTAILMHTAMLAPFILIFAIIIRALYFKKWAIVQAFGMRAAFAERLHDIVAIVNSFSILELRSYAFGLPDNDVRCLDYALDTLQYTKLGLQENALRKIRASPKPFKINVPGRLEGEMQHRGLGSPQDARRQLRRLQNVLGGACDRLSAGSSGSNSLGVGQSTGTSRVIKDIFKEALQKTGSKELNEQAFVDAFESVTTKYQNPMERDDLKKIFQYIDVNMNGTLSSTEFYHAMISLPIPVLDNGEAPRMADVAKPAESSNEHASGMPLALFAAGKNWNQFESEPFMPSVAEQRLEVNGYEVKNSPRYKCWEL